MNKYTYHRGKHLRLIEDRTQFISRASREALRSADFDVAAPMSLHSFRVRVPDAERPGAVNEAVAMAQKLGEPAFGYYKVPDDDESPDGASEFNITDRLFVTFRQEQSEGALAKFKDRHELTELQRDEPHNTFLMKTAAHVDPIRVVQKLTEDPDEKVLLAEHDVNHRLVPQFVLPSDPDYMNQWHLHNITNDDLFKPVGSMRAEDAWKSLQSFGDPKVVIGVIDFGFNIDHPDLAGDKVAGWAYFEKRGPHSVLIDSSDSNAKRERLQEGPIDLALHGTACAALAAAAADGSCTVGVAPASRLYLARLPIDGKPGAVISDSQFVTLLRHLDQKVDVITSSWAPIDPQSNWSKAVAVTLADIALHGGHRRRKGIVFFWGAGNSNRPIVRSFTSNVPVPYAFEAKNGEVHRLFTARTFKDDLVGLPNVLHVAASTSNGRRAHYSNYGYGVSISAPSSNKDFFGCSNPAPGIPIRAAGFDRNGPHLNGSFGGTSAASPIAAGAAALVIAANDALSARQVVSILKKTAERDALDVKSQYPRVKCDFVGIYAADDVSPVHPFDDGTFKDTCDQDAPRSHWFGAGRVDACAAVEAAVKMKQTASAVTPKVNAKAKTLVG